MKEGIKIPKPQIKKPDFKKLGNKKVMLIVVAVVVIFMAFNVFKRPYDKPEIVTIKSNETAFLVPVVGDMENQKKFLSEDDMRNQLVTEKDIKIPHYWLQTGRLPGQGEWRGKARLLVIDRTPVTREWVNGPGGTNQDADEAIKVEAKDSITFYSGMNCTAMIKENDAVQYRYNYGERPLEAIMDTEIRPMVEALYAEIAGTMPYEGVISNKDQIISYIRNGRQEMAAIPESKAEYDANGNLIKPFEPARPAKKSVKGVISYFKERGITISVLGMKGGLTPENAEIQKAIDEKFKAEKDYQTQQAINKRNVEQSQSEAQAKLEAQRALNEMKVEQATADAKAVKIKASVIDQELKLKRMEVMLMEAEAKLERAKRWNGEYPDTLVTDAKNANMFLGLPGLTGKDSGTQQ
ncbi:HlyD family secretion protein [Anaeromicrobium sediminis]|uniref:Band 7 domain-containing protein n=1 Tax=Anaeromicrobium sediminis TaxID=1478221 RepID=A0A267MNU0_9FIRM|nr:hypothetical protein [Anaeromicrobium sediminis]PAB61072.1 hypothetical protein CCE28_01190 [Anaeromicrobium sediminis]